MIYKEVTFEEFEKAFKDLERADHFPNTLRHLFDYRDDLSKDLPEGYLKLDVISLCLDFSEYTLNELIENFGDDYDAGSDYFMSNLKRNLNVIDCKNGYYLVSE